MNRPINHLQVPIWKQAAELREAVPWLLALAAMVIGMLLWDLAVGRSARVTYLGPMPGVAIEDTVRLETDPPGNYRMARGPLHSSLKRGCRYDLNYTVPYGRYRGTQRPRHVRAATLVDCPKT